MINFNCNNFSLISEAVSTAMQESIRKCREFRTPSYGTDQYVKAEIEKARSQISGLLNVNNSMLFFIGNGNSSDSNLILSILNLLKINVVVTSKSEEEDKLVFLEQLQKCGKIELKFIPVNNRGKFSTQQLLAALNSDNQRKLISLSHANRITGELLPVKEVLSHCNMGNNFFHLNANLMIGRYNMDFEKLLPHFMSFGCNLLHGPTDIGAVIINPLLNVETEEFNLIYRFLQINENKNPSIISGFETALCFAYNRLSNYQEKISTIKDYLIEKLAFLPDIQILGQEEINKGLINLVPISINSANFRQYLKENLDLNGFSVNCYQQDNENASKSAEMTFLIALDEQINKLDVDNFIDCLESLRKS